MTQPFLGEIRMFSFNYAPKSYAMCNGQLLPLAQNLQLFALLGTTYGGDGVTTFALPDLRGQWVVGRGQGAGLTDRLMGETGGQDFVTLDEGQMPSHTHTVTGTMGSMVPDRSTSPQNRFWSNDPKAATPAAQEPPYKDTQPDTNMSPGTIADTGGNQAHENRSPFLTITYCIALQGPVPTPPPPPP